ncbi:MAG: Ig-like domain-containing protein, partial [Thermoplasmata archaeon]|nr:Ig-like domain-containing protein [Thermoplasmata archaeon]
MRGFGIFLANSCYNEVINNTASINEIGIYILQFCFYNEIENNTCLLNDEAGILSLGGSYSNITFNNVSNNLRGIELYLSQDNTIVNNNIYSNVEYGIWLYESEYTLLYHNNICGNGNEGDSTTLNFWDYGYPVGGNYWSDYDGTDNYRGPNQDIPGSDGLGDTPYGINETQDNYPLMNPWPYSDTYSPLIVLNTPSNNSIIPAQSVLDFNVSDANLDTVSYNFDGGVNFSFDPPYDIDTSAWLDGVYNITVFANDTAGNNASGIFVFTIDGTSPDITLNSPANNTTIRPGVPLNFTVTDAHLDSANYSVNGGTVVNLSFPFDIDTTGWADGVYNVSVNAVDEVNNTASEHYVFTIDCTPPTVLWATPANGTTNVSVDTNITVQFSEPVNTSTFGLFFAINPQADNWIIHWHANNTTFYIDPILDPNTNYTVIVGGAEDFAGNLMLANYTFRFSTWLDFDEDGYPDFNDTDDDNDGVLDVDDAFPFDPLEYLDTDNDGIGNNADPDDDGDGVLDSEDPDPLDPDVSHVDIDPAGGIGEFWWILIIMLLVVIVAVVALFLKLRGVREEEYE